VVDERQRVCVHMWAQSVGCMLCCLSLQLDVGILSGVLAEVHRQMLRHEYKLVQTLQ